MGGKGTVGGRGKMSSRRANIILRMTSTRVSVETHPKIRRGIQAGVKDAGVRHIDVDSEDDDNNHGHSSIPSRYKRHLHPLLAAAAPFATPNGDKVTRNDIASPPNGISTVPAVAGLTDLLLFPKSAKESSPSEVLDTALKLPIMPLKAGGMRDKRIGTQRPRENSPL